MDVSKVLKGHDVFRSFPPKQVDAITAFTSAKMLDKGETVYTTDRKATHVHVLLEGCVELHLRGAPAHPGLLVSRVQNGELFGVAPLLGCERYTTQAVCAAASKILYVEARPLIEMMKDNALIGQDIMSSVARAYFDRYQRLVERVQRVIADLASEV
jgi:signal-transduction protein with cAMP-binding, CBS, and nucleotidyltransferase domain